MRDKRIYREELLRTDTYSVWLVDGEYIRKELNENFVKHDNNSHLKFIPKDEFWIDRETNPHEHHFFIDHFLMERRALKEGKAGDEAWEKANRFEKRERAKVLHHSEHSHNKTDLEILKKIHKDLLQTYSDEIKIWLVDGKAVRDYLFLDYAEGGHDLVYDFIPEKEIWIEEILSPHERKFIILHELHERFLMAGGKDYPHAHRGATIVEDHYRENVKEDLDLRITQELKNNNQETAR